VEWDEPPCVSVELRDPGGYVVEVAWDPSLPTGASVRRPEPGQRHAVVSVSA
jgi:hypothetical protein